MHHLNVYQVDNIRNIHILSTLNLICYVSTDIRNDNLPDRVDVASPSPWSGNLSISVILT